MAALVAAIHFPETEQNYFRLWKMDGPDEPGHDGMCYGGTPRHLDLFPSLYSSFALRTNKRFGRG